MAPSKPFCSKNIPRDEEMTVAKEALNVSDPASRVAAARHRFDPQQMSKAMTEKLDVNDPASRLAVTRHMFEDPKVGMGLMEMAAPSYIPFAGVLKGLTAGSFRSGDDKDEDEPRSVPSQPVHQLGQYKGVNISIEVSDTFAFDTPEMMKLATTGQIGADDGTYVYSRCCNPTVVYLSSYMAAMENTESAYCTACGMSAITATMIHLCKSGGHIVSSNAIYAGSRFLFTSFLPEKCNVSTTFVDITNLQEVDDAIVDGQTNVLFFECVSNPALIVADVYELCEIAHKKGVRVVVDNTFTPMILTPANLGVDVVLHSLTKYVSGGADIMAGAICGTDELLKDMTSFTGGPLLMLGPTMNPKEAFELVERFSHMGMRIKKQCNRAMKLAQRMRDELGIKVIYPGLADHPQHALLNSMKNKGYGFGAMLCVDMGTTQKAFDLVRNLKEQQFGFLAVSLGYYENLISCPGPDDRKHAVPKPKKQGDLSPGLIRISVGYIGTLENKWKQFKNAYHDAMKK